VSFSSEEPVQLGAGAGDLFAVCVVASDLGRGMSMSRIFWMCPGRG